MTEAAGTPGSAGDAPGAAEGGSGGAPRAVEAAVRVSDSTCALRFERVTVVFPGGTHALREVSFEVPRGQLCAIIGPSGAGKSTLLRLVNGMQEPTAGRVVFHGAPISYRSRRQLRDVQRKVGMVHQQFQLVPRLPVLDNVAAGALPDVGTARVLLRAWPAALVRRVCALLEQVGLDEEHLYRPAATLSGGQQQRVAIARAFVLRPEVVLADEPVASLDPSISRGVLGLLADASRQAGATVLCSLHQIELAREFGDRVIAIRDGRVVFDGPPADIDRDVFAAVFDGAPAGGSEGAAGSVR